MDHRTESSAGRASAESSSVDRSAPLTARNFPTAQQEAEGQSAPSRYDGPESAYRLAFTDSDFLLREELRPVRMQLELLKPEMVQAEQGIESTIVIFGSARIVSRDVAQRLVDDATAAGNDDALRIAKRHLAMSRYYEEARRCRDRHDEVPRTADAALRRHRRRPRIMEAGSRGARRGRRQEHRAEHRAAARTGAEPVHHAGAVLPVPLLRPAQDALPDAFHRAGVLPRGLRHARRDVRGADAHPDRQVPAPSPC